MSKTVWRITDRSFADSAFSGEGASIVGGRWNSKGRRMVYTAEHLSLAILEVFVHLNVPIVEPNSFVIIPAEIPDDISIEHLTLEQLPSNWQSSEQKISLKVIGDRWLDSCNTAILAVPSAIVSQELNYLINPQHLDFNRLIIHPPQVYNFDRRMWK